MLTLGCKNCTNGFIITYRPANKVMIDGSPAYPADDTTLLGYAEPCPICNGGEALIENIQIKANIPTALYDIDLAKLDWGVYDHDVHKQREIAASFVRSYAVWKKHGFGLYIWSKMKGSGKTYLASAICNALIRQYGILPQFISASGLIETSKTPGGIDDLCRCDLLVIDDLGLNQSGTQWVADILFRIIDARMQNKRLTIATSNIEMGQLPYDERIIDRLYKTMQPLPLPDQNLRAIMANKERRSMLEQLGLVYEQTRISSERELT